MQRSETRAIGASVFAERRVRDKMVAQTILLRLSRRCSRLRAASVLVLVPCAIECRSDGPLIPVSDAPFVFVVLTSTQTTIGPPPLDSSIVGVLLTAGSPLSSPFRHAESFEVQRASDGALFPWTERVPDSGLTGADFRGIAFADGNYTLKHTSTTDGLGADSIAPLQSYLLSISTQGSQVTGRTTVPAIPQPRLIVDGARRFVVFGPVAGAAGYIPSAETEIFEGALTTDTILELHYGRGDVTPPNPQFQVIALDTNAFRYVSDTTLTTSGLVGALGLFGSASSARLTLPRQ